MNRPVVISTGRRVEGSPWLPGDKSISHRAILIAAMADSPVKVLRCSPAADVLASARLAAAMGARVNHDPQLDGDGTGSSRVRSQNLVVYPVKADSAEPRELRRHVDIGNSGTSIRVGMGICASVVGETYLDGDKSIRRRPMGRVVEPLRRMGAVITGADGGDRAPLVVTGTELTGVAHRLEVSSAQVKSALLLAGLRAEGVTSVFEPSPSRDHTERMLMSLGVSIDISTDGWVVRPTRVPGGTVEVPADISAAAPFMAAAAILEGSELRIEEVGLNPTRTGFIDILRAYGASISIEDVAERSGEPRGTVTVRAGDRRRLEVDGELALRAIDELPLVAVLGAFAEGTTTVAGASELRVKESDRIEATAAGLGAMGVSIQTTPDGFAVAGRGRPLGGVEVDPAGDHRLAMAFAVAALGSAEGATIADPSVVDISHPGFFDDLASVTVA